MASYFTIEVDGQRNENAAWYYPDPKPAAVAIKDRVAFWRGSAGANTFSAPQGREL